MKPEQADILTIGDCSIDLFMRIADGSMQEEREADGQTKVFFYHGSKIPVEDFETSIAGNSLNVAVAATILGLKTAIYTETGRDENTVRLIRELKDLKINTEHVIQNENTPTDVHTIIVFNAERTIFSYHGKRAYKMQNWEKPKCVYYTSIGKGFEKFQEQLIEYLNNNQDILVAFNPGTFQMKAGLIDLKPFLKVTHVLILNKEEVESLLGIKTNDLEEYHKELQKLGPKLTVITDAENGASASDGTKTYDQPAYTDPRPVLDMTGAGDAFAASFVAAILYGKTIETALKWGVINANNQIKEIGAIKGLLDKKSIEQIAEKI
ncbi:carbohydrate kinase family protein [candidate division WWE3 bacterium]|uniref:Carbohydrate kinase family protein n=1 Tax=candidate division WWE3 bacterium TaxID=2053526 RepID=A0A7X9DKF7_UNCKA|nr:carbohydrate kinase family protein [candidate division WWE3 bacterium]